jgi:hypothetical protein
MICKSVSLGDLAMRLALFALSALFSISCLNLTPKESQRKKPQSVEVNLPAKPSLSSAPVPTKYEDGALTVEGFFKSAQDILNKPKEGRKVTVRGTVKAIEKCKEGEMPCFTVPHLVLIDNPSRPKNKLIVVSEPPEAILEGHTLNAVETITGEVAMWSLDGRLVDLRGLLLVTKEPQSE